MPRLKKIALRCLQDNNLIRSVPSFTLCSENLASLLYSPWPHCKHRIRALFKGVCLGKNGSRLYPNSPQVERLDLEFSVFGADLDLDFVCIEIEKSNYIIFTRCVQQTRIKNVPKMKNIQLEITKFYIT